MGRGKGASVMVCWCGAGSGGSPLLLASEGYWSASRWPSISVLLSPSRWSLTLMAQAPSSAGMLKPALFCLEPPVDSRIMLL